MSAFDYGQGGSPSADGSVKKNTPEFTAHAAVPYDGVPPPMYRDDVESGMQYDPEAATMRASLDPTSKYVANANRLVRQGFIRKVFSLLTIMLVQAFGLVGLFVGVKSIRDFVQAHPGLLYLAYGVMLVTVIMIACGGDMRRRHPTNLILLFTYATAQAYFVATIASFYTSQSVLMCVGMLAVVVFCLTLFATQTSVDFTGMYSALFGCLICLMLFGFLNLFLQVEFMDTVYAGLGTLLFSVYLCADVQLVMGNKKHRLTEDEYVFAALLIYQDIIQLFLYLLRLFGERRR